MNLGLILSTLLALPQSGSPAEAVHLDVIELKGGGRIEGVVVAATDSYVEVEIGTDTVVGFERTRIASIERGGVVDVDPDEPLLALRDDWFVLHDAEGRVVGKFHSTVTTDDHGHLRIGEEWQFERDGEAAEITRLDVVSSDLEPVSTFYRERRRRVFDDRVVGESLVHGAVVDDQLVVETQTRGVRDRRVYPLDAKLQFPLAALETLRQGELERDVSLELFDAGTAQFVERKFAVDTRSVEWRGEVRRVREIRSLAGRSNWEWVDRNGRSLRREINGPSLVAVPVDASMARSYQSSADALFPPSYVLEPESRFALWMPQPTWRVGASTEPGRVIAWEPVHGGSACLLVLDQLEEGLLLESAADTVSRWLHKVKPGVRAAIQEKTAVREKSAVRLRATYMERRRGAAASFRCDVYVFEVEDQFVALCFDAPERAFDALERDFQRMLRSVDLYPVVESVETSKVAGN